MKVLFISRKFPPSVGGMELFASELSGALSSKLTLRLITWGGHGRVKAVLIALPSLTLRAFAALTRGGYDVIHAQDGLLAPSAYLLSRLFRKPFTVVIHGLDATYGNPLFKAVVPWSLRRANLVFCISQVAADEVIKLGVSSDKVRVIPLAVVDTFDPEISRAASRQQLDVPADSKVLITVGRLVKRKGVAWFIEAVLPDLIKKHSDLLYLVVGEGDERPAIEASIVEYDLNKHVRLLGRVSDEDRTAAYHAADLFVMPNINVPNDVEGFGLVLLEASTHQLPVVAANTEGIADAVSDGHNGVLVSVKDAQAFEVEIEKFISDPAHVKNFGKNSRAYTLEHYQWDKIADRYLEQYQTLLH